MDTFEWTRLVDPLRSSSLFNVKRSTEIIYHSEDDYYGEEKSAYYLEIEVSDMKRRRWRKLLILLRTFNRYRER